MFAPHQIVYLECNQTQLYGEVIQVLEARQMCWVRPIMLVHSMQSWEQGAPVQVENAGDSIHPIPEGPDLLWPLHQFRLPLDTEVIPLLATMQTIKPVDKSSLTANQRLRQFIDQLWIQQSRIASS